MEIINKSTANLPKHPSDFIAADDFSLINGAIYNFMFDYATPTGNEDSLINSLRLGDLVYLSAHNKVKKVKVQTPNATLKKSRVFPVIRIGDVEGNEFYEKDFTTTEGHIGCIFKPTSNIELYIDKLFIHNENSTSADQRIPLNYATHCLASGSCLEGLIKALSFSSLDLTGNSSVAKTVFFVN